MSYLSACITRILSLSAFDAALKTKDIQQAFSVWENDRGGFKIKWINDTSLLIVFADPNVAKRAYLQTLLEPPAQFVSTVTGDTAVIRPYDGPDAQTVIAAVNQRAQGGHRGRASVSGLSVSQPTNGHHNRGDSLATKAFNGNGPLNGLAKSAAPVPVANGTALHGSILNNISTVVPGAATNGTGKSSREPSPTLPSLPTHPTLNALINSTLADMAAPPGPIPTSVSAPMFPISGLGQQLSGGSPPRTPPEGGAPTPPRLGNPAKRMLGSALGIRHPALGPRVLSGSMSSDLQTIGEVHRALDGLAIAE